MEKIKLISNNKTYDVSLSTYSFSPIRKKITFYDEFDITTINKGFKIINEHNPILEQGDFSNFKYVYKNEHKLNIYILTTTEDDIYIEPVIPEPEPTPEPEPPTLEEIKYEKVAEMNMIQQNTIQEGINVTLTNGTVEHFTLSDHDQTSLVGLQTQVAVGADNIPWHTSDTTEHCKYYDNADMALIVTGAMQFVTFHVTYFRDLRIYISSLSDIDAVKDVLYGMIIPKKYQSEVLADMYASMNA